MSGHDERARAGGSRPAHPPPASSNDPAPCAVRLARPGDLARIWELLLGLAAYERLEREVAGRPEQLGEDLFGPRPLLGCAVAESGGRLVGYALFYPVYSSFRTLPAMWLEDLFVEPAERGRGTGRALLAFVARNALDRGCRALDWLVLDWNRPSISFYERLGARPADGGWLEYGLDHAAMQALADPPRAGPSGPGKGGGPTSSVT